MRTTIFIALLAFSIIYALRKGGQPERAVAIVFLLMTISDPFVHALTPIQYTQLDPGHFVIDLAGWIALLAIALRARRFWPLWVSSFQTVSLVAHVVRLLDYSIHPVAYGVMQVAGSYPLVILLMIGTFNHQQRFAENGNDPHWRS
jgi:hypothetical protein